jgi:hypothetical protein
VANAAATSLAFSAFSYLERIMSHVPYLDAGKFDKTQEAFNAIAQAIIMISQPHVSAEIKEKETSAAIRGVNDLGRQVINTLKEIDRRLHKLENAGR